MTPDALLLLLLSVAVHGVVRAVEVAGQRAGTGWLVLSGTALGFSILTDGLRGSSLLPVLAVVAWPVGTRYAVPTVCVLLLALLVGVCTVVGVTVTSDQLTDLVQDAETTWSAELQLASLTPVMALGGWSGTEKTPTLAQFEAYVATGSVRYLVTSGSELHGVPARITDWVAADYSSRDQGTPTVYDLSSTRSGVTRAGGLIDGTCRPRGRASRSR